MIRNKNFFLIKFTSVRLFLFIHAVFNDIDHNW